MYDGVINVYKEKGFTSHDVVAKLRGILHMKKIGHTGTLDPDAEGVLPVVLGKATKLAEFLTDKDKTYEAVLLLGRVTDTQDTTGKVLSERPVNDLHHTGSNNKSFIQFRVERKSRPEIRARIPKDSSRFPLQWRSGSDIRAREAKSSTWVR